MIWGAFSDSKGLSVNLKKMSFEIWENQQFDCVFLVLYFDFECALFMDIASLSLKDWWLDSILLTVLFKWPVCSF